MNIKNKVLIVIIICVILMFNLPTHSRAAFSMEDIFSGAKSFISAGSESSAKGITSGELNSISQTVSGILLTIAIAVTFISIAVMGINFAIQTVEDKAKIKEAMIPWVIGVFISFGAYGIWKMVMGIFYKMNL